MNRKSAFDKAMTALGLTTAAGLVFMTFPQSATGSDRDGSIDTQLVAPDQLPSTIELTGVVRDFREKSEEGGHPDFERKPDGGFGHYMGVVANQLGADGKPMFSSLGSRVSSNWRDASGRNIISPKEYIEARPGDVAGSLGSAGGAVSGESAFPDWFRDKPGMNVSTPLSLTLVREEGNNVYVFDDRDDPTYSNLGGFFPINGALFGNSAGESKNFHFTFELATEFTYQEGAGHTFTFIGDDDVWVFIDGKLVIDLGGVHSKISQTIELDRLGWLEDGQKYDLHFFFAERHRTQSNFRIETTLTLRNAELPAVSAMYD